METPRITLLQTDIIWQDVRANLRHLSELLRKAPKSDLYVLPEMFSTGFVTNPQTLSDEDLSATLPWMQQMAKELDAAVAGSVAVRDEDGGFRNRFFFVFYDETVHYDKTHLFAYGGEDLHYVAGEGAVEVTWRRVRYRLQVCFDLRFPESARNHSDKPYDVLLYVANWPASRRQQWDMLLRGRAIENQCYVIGVNRVGDDPTTHYDGGSCVIDPLGQAVLTATDGQEDVCCTTLDTPRLAHLRQRFPVLQSIV